MATLVVNLSKPMVAPELPCVELGQILTMWRSDNEAGLFLLLDVEDRVFLARALMQGEPWEKVIENMYEEPTEATTAPSTDRQSGCSNESTTDGSIE